MKASLRIAVSNSTEQESASVLDQAPVYAIAGLLLFAPLAFGAVEPWAIYILEAGAALLFLFWAVRRAMSDELQIIGNAAFPPMLAFGALIVLQIVGGTTAYRQATTHSLLLYCAYGLLCFLAVQYLRKTKQAQSLARILTIYGFAVALFALFQGLASNGKLYWLRAPSAGGWIYGPYVNHNHYAGIMEMLLPIPLVISLGRMTAGPRRILAAGAASLMAVTIFLSGSRGGMLAFAVQMAILAGFLIKKKKGLTTAWALGAFLVVIVGLLVWIGGGELTQRMASIQSEARTEVAGGTRTQIVRDGLKMFAVHPVVGFGLGCFPEVYPQYRSFFTNLYVNHAHNDYLQLLVETGAVGFAIMLWLMGTVFVRAAKKVSGWVDDPNACLALIAILGCAGIAVHSFVDFNLQIPANAALFYVLCVMGAMEPCFGSHRRLPREYRGRAA